MYIEPYLCIMDRDICPEWSIGVTVLTSKLGDRFE